MVKYTCPVPGVLGFIINADLPPVFMDFTDCLSGQYFFLFVSIM